jgi:hypothetical protein
MATVSIPGLQAAVAEIGLAPFPSFVEADVLSNPIDIFHAYLAEHLQSYVECDPQLVYNSIQASNTIENGDLDIVLPKLKLPGVSPKDLAGQLLKKVCNSSFLVLDSLWWSRAILTYQLASNSFNVIHCSLLRSKMASIFASKFLHRPFHDCFSHTLAIAKPNMGLSNPLVCNLNRSRNGRRLSLSSHRRILPGSLRAPTYEAQF